MRTKDFKIGSFWFIPNQKAYLIKGKCFSCSICPVVLCQAVAPICFRRAHVLRNLKLWMQICSKNPFATFLNELANSVDMLLETVIN